MADDEYPTVEIGGEKIPYDPEQLRKINEHPCYSEKACHSAGRMHLAVAPKCNIQCNYCVRDFDCVNESRPGVCSEVLSPEEAIELVKKALSKFPYIKVIGIAGPGDPLANEETFETLRLLKEEFPTPIKCLSTNGLLLPESIDRLLEYDVGNVTVTMNAVDPAIGEKIYSFVEWEGKKLHGREAAEKLLSQQLKGIEMAVSKKMLVKVNTVFIPGVNDHHIIDIAKKAGEMGVFTFNLIPVIPQYKFKDIVPPTPKEKREMQDSCSPFVRQMRHCQRCRSDAIGKLGHDVQDCLYNKKD
ncbi:nitrogenase cofactor biosynthesis protein NifB [Methanoplanus sp. FWC-SCC4]|uniref:Nitrogenase cofactor biosynthesis protein NifB n=1 Tax=Methanochimaera problematica TaxID=2609417 RepID=A0AA97I3L5_9EURY|nr:nitrogenase cofactor biosynthesis protein NifB [Methanoplanus sp. FWC-SCC4]WOF15674.1 nitrogenase cofactor biosynthesis protein NifB [Methanoplanus sp. FWC-SCC4]